MFETLENTFEKSKPPLNRGWAILMYSVNILLSAFALILEAGHRPSQGHSRLLLLSLVAWLVMLVLSFVWLVNSLKCKGAISRRDFGVRFVLLQSLFLVAAGFADILR